MSVYTIDPLRDPRWAEFVDRHESASLFHSVAWLKAIRRTYGYTPVVYTTSPPAAALTNGIVFCEIKSWLTGRRMVSLPFSDHCEPLLDNYESNSVELAREMKAQVDSGKWKYVEIRPSNDLRTLDGVVRSETCSLHFLDLTASEEAIFRRTHKTSIQQRIRRAEREGIVCETGTSKTLLEAFYRLLLLTRRRHQLPPQPAVWFENIIESLGDKLQIHVAFHQGREIAAILTVRHKRTSVYKYSCSDERFSNMGGGQLLLWRAICAARQSGATSMDFGRSDADNPGLITFKNRWGAIPSEMNYLRWSAEQSTGKESSSRVPSQFLKRCFSMMPDALLQATGRILYRHVG